MKKHLIAITTSLVILGWMGCEDFVEREPVDALTASNFYSTADELRQATIGLYNLPWFSYNDKAAIALGDGGGGNWTTLDGAFRPMLDLQIPSSFNLVGFTWSSFYSAVANANVIIFTLQNSSGDYTQEEENLAIAEARFMRGAAYFYLATTFGDVPIVHEGNYNQLLIEPQVRTNSREDVYQFAIQDMEYAAEHLLDTDDPGRVTQWAAKGMLAKIYLYKAGVDGNGSRDEGDLEMARNYAQDVIMNSGKGLREDYGDLFKIGEEDTNEGATGESLWALQWTFRLNQWGVQNTHQAYHTPAGDICACGDGWGGGNGPSPDMLALYEDGDLRRKETFMIQGDFYPELRQDLGGYLYGGESEAGGVVKKYVVGSPDDNGGPGTVGFMNSPLNTYMLRLAEVYLIYAEAILGNNASTTDTEALTYYNMIRDRAGLADDADGSLTFREIFDQKRVELAMEGNTWFELVRWSLFDMDATIDYVSNQNKGRYTWEPLSAPDSVFAPNGDTLVILNRPVASELFMTPAASDFVIPYPEGEITANPLLREDPVEFVF